MPINHGIPTTRLIGRDPRIAQSTERQVKATLLLAAVLAALAGHPAYAQHARTPTTPAPQAPPAARTDEPQRTGHAAMGHGAMDHSAMGDMKGMHMASAAHAQPAMQGA